MIGILSACDSERHLVTPVVHELGNIGLRAEIIPIEQCDIMESYRAVNFIINNSTQYPKIKFILAVADRPEQMGGVLAAFHNRIPIGHLYAGDHNTISTFDDIHRHAITLYSQIQFCSSEEATANVRKLMLEAGLDSNAYTVGATHFDSIDLDAITRRYRNSIFNFPNTKGGYVLVLINSETLGDDSRLISEVLDKACSYKNTIFVQVKGNGDTPVDNDLFNRLNSEVGAFCIERIDHELFIYLMRNCKAFITNSSASIYEAPALLREDQIIIVGNRNRGRTPVPKEAHDGQASKRIASILKDFMDIYV